MNKPKKENYEDQYVCTACGNISEPHTITRGNFLIEVVLWLFFLIPGLIYTIWRLTSKYSACPKCGNPTMIPINTPKGMELIKSLEIKASQPDSQEGAKEHKKKSKLTFAGVLVIGFIILVFVWIGSLASNNSTSSDQTQQNQKQEVLIKQGKFLEYDYQILQKQGESKYVATFSPFLPRNDVVVTGMIFEVIKQVYGKNTVKDLQLKIVERNGQNLLLFQGVKTNYFFLLVKEDTGEVHSFVFWNE